MIVEFRVSDGLDVGLINLDFEDKLQNYQNLVYKRGIQINAIGT